jgi:hypothetical protein
MGGVMLRQHLPRLGGIPGMPKRRKLDQMYLLLFRRKIDYLYSHLKRKGYICTEWSPNGLPISLGWNGNSRTNGISSVYKETPIIFHHIRVD